MVCNQDVPQKFHVFRGEDHGGSVLICGSTHDESIAECTVRRWAWWEEANHWGCGPEGCIFLLSSSLLSLCPGCHAVSTFPSAVPLHHAIVGLGASDYGLKPLRCGCWGFYFCEVLRTVIFRDREQNNGCQGLGEGRNEKLFLIGVEFQFCEIKSSGNDTTI